MSENKPKLLLYAEIGMFPLNIYSVEWIDDNYVPFGDCPLNSHYCKYCEGNQERRWVSVTVNATPELPAPDGGYGSFCSIKCFCDECYEIIKPVIEKSYNQSKTDKKKKFFRKKFVVKNLFSEKVSN